jgi:hypothetical protein
MSASKASQTNVSRSVRVEELGSKARDPSHATSRSATTAASEYTDVAVRRG